MGSETGRSVSGVKGDGLSTDEERRERNDGGGEHVYVCESVVGLVMDLRNMHLSFYTTQAKRLSGQCQGFPCVEL